MNFLSFSCGEHNLAIAVDDVEEVTKLDKITKVPMSHKSNLGICIINRKSYCLIDILNFCNIASYKEYQYEKAIMLKNGSSMVAASKISQVINERDYSVSNDNSLLSNISKGVLQNANGDKYILLDVDKINNIEY